MDDKQTSTLSDGLVRVKDVAEFMAISRRHVYRMLDNGQLPWVKIGDARRIPTQAVVDFVNKNYHQQKGHA